MKSIKHSFLLLLLIGMGVASCSKSDIKNTAYEYEVDLRTGEDACFEMVYPISFTIINGDVQVANNLDEVKEIYKNNEDPKPSLIYPVDVIVDEITKTIDTEKSLIKMKKDCK